MQEAPFISEDFLPLIVWAIIWARSTARVDKKKKQIVVVGKPESFTKFG
jgi:hypothetical protein